MNRLLRFLIPCAMLLFAVCLAITPHTKAPSTTPLLQGVERMEAGDYAAARAILEEALEQQPQDAALQAALADCLFLEQEQAQRELEQELMALSFPAALEKINKLKAADPKSVRLTYLEQQTRRRYEEETLQNALSLCDREAYAEALSLLNEALTFLDSKPLRDMEAYVQSSYPHPLLALGLMPAPGLTLVPSEAYGPFSLPQGYVEADLHGAYARFTATLWMPEDMQPTAFQTGARLSIYADGELLQEHTLSEAERGPIELDVDMTGVQTLRLSWTSLGANGQKNWGQMATLNNPLLHPVPLPKPSI
ncbi:MAG: NPCBM/NEW2 domain-containing protein [Clostridia bacterium]|nr:NPCBM/NEW2 domain-containing protein [Clostridia bacterium]